MKNMAVVLVGSGANGLLLFELMRKIYPTATAVIGDAPMVRRETATGQADLACLMERSLSPETLAWVERLMATTATRLLILTETAPIQTQRLRVMRARSTLIPEAHQVANELGVELLALRDFARKLVDH